MQNKLRYGLILIAIVPGLLTIPGCSKNTTQTEAPVVQEQEQEMTAEKTAEALEQERLEREEREAAERKLRAEKIKFMYEDVYFKKGRYSLNPGAQEILRRKAQWLLNNPEITVLLEGHTDERGTKEYNFALGDLRAGAVKSFLIRQGIESPRLIAVSYGNERPIDNSKTETGREKNRRVHFVVEE
jgi:peptidoglycan-associated lipoprotein